MRTVNPLEPGPRFEGLFWRCRNVAGTPIMEGKMLLRKLGLLRNDKTGVTAIEYGLIAGAVAVMIIGAVTTLGTNISNTFTAVSTALTTASAGSGTGTTPP